jgi:hypothetical protein
MIVMPSLATMASNAAANFLSRSRPAHLPAQDRQLVTKDQDLQLLRAFAAREQHDQLEPPADDDIDDRHDYERPPEDGLPTLPRRQ